MKTITNIFRSISDTELYKSQFTNDNSLPNILMVNPMLNQQEFYQMIFPGLVLNTAGIADVAFTSISKFEPQKTTPSQITEMEVVWANSIVFPFTVLDIQLEICQCRDINPAAKIIYFIDCEFWNHGFSRTIGTISGQQNKILAEINKNVFHNLIQCDRVVVHSDSLKTALCSWIREQEMVVDNRHDMASFDWEAFVQVIELCNDETLLNEGIVDNSKFTHRDPDHIRVFIECLDGQSINTVFKQIEMMTEDPSRKSITFFSRNNFPPHPLIQKLKSVSLQHLPRELHANQYDYYLVCGKADLYNRHRFISGDIIEMAYFGAIPVVSSPQIYNALPDKIKNSSISLSLPSFFEKINETTEEDYRARVELGFQCRNLNLFESNADTADRYLELFYNQDPINGI